MPGSRQLFPKGRTSGHSRTHGLWRYHEGRLKGITLPAESREHGAAPQPSKTLRGAILLYTDPRIYVTGPDEGESCLEVYRASA